MDLYHHILLPGWHLFRHRPFIDWEALRTMHLDDPRWSERKAQDWYAVLPYLIGCNYIPAYAGNQLEMWGKATFDPVQIERELALASGAGMNCVRVYLHDLLYEHERASFFRHLETFLELCHKHSILVIPVFFDDCWNRDPEYPNKHHPKRGTHNSMWLQSPGAGNVIKRDRWPLLQHYITETVGRFANDERIIFWDVYNEPGNAGLGKRSGQLLEKAFEWARSAGPCQPLTSGFHAIKSVAEIALRNSDIITFHHYAALPKLKRLVLQLEQVGRPMICTEYMGRTEKSLFRTHLPLLYSKNIGAVHWGLVSGRSQTKYPWHTILLPARRQPGTWFHDVFHSDHRPYDDAEIEILRKISEQAADR